MIHKLMLGKPVSVGVLGGSVTAGNWVTKVGYNDWFAVFSRFMSTAFPNATLTFRNGAVPGTQSDYGVMCMEMAVDPHADLVFIEYNLNDGVLGTAEWRNSKVLNTERLVRRLLALPGKPAVVFMHILPHGGAEYPGNPKVLYRRFHETDEDLKGALSQYYDLPTLSLRTALYRLAVWQQRQSFKWPDLFYDEIHPNNVGHKAMADLAAYLVQQAALDLWLEPYNTLRYDAELEGEPLPPPMVPGNEPPTSSMCVMEEKFQELVTQAEGWAWVLEGTSSKPKKGYASTVPGTKLRLRIDTVRKPNEMGLWVPVHLAHLKSYTNIGRAELTCVSGCKCQPHVVDGYVGDGADRVSLMFFETFLVSQAKECELQVEVLNTTHTNSTKFKVAGVVVSEHAVKDMEEAKRKDPFTLISHYKQSVTLTDFVLDQRSAEDMRQYDKDPSKVPNALGGRRNARRRGSSRRRRKLMAAETAGSVGAATVSRQASGLGSGGLDGLGVWGWHGGRAQQSIEDRNGGGGK